MVASNVSPLKAAPSEARSSPLRFCLALDHLDWTRRIVGTAVERTVRFARLADEAGLDSVWLNEDPEGWDAFAVLGALARETARVRLGTGVTNPYHRHPNLIAASAATLDRLTNGRAFLGLGRGQPEWYARALGVAPLGPLPLLEETIDLLEQWWSPPHRAAAEGPLPVRDWERSIAPLGRPPIYLAAAGPRALDLAGRRADGVLFNALASPEYLAEAIARVRASAAAAGRDPGKLAFFANPVAHVTDDPEPELERKKGFIATVHALPGMERLLETPGFDIASIVANVRRAMKTEEILGRGGGFPDLRREGDLAAARRAIPTELVAHLAAVGPLPVVRERLHSLAAIGATHVFLDRRGLPPDATDLRRLVVELGAATS
jgi:alkanesulfonate monooxygenase SsuD/methylene tetrahydromethanopterin reductase-like flavin-dependent oxidoreductase (luciferase family)